MKLILVHGINNQGRSANAIEQEWMLALHAGWQGIGLAAPAGLQIHTAYYGDELAAFVKAKAEAASRTVKAGAAGGASRTVSSQEYEFFRDLAKAYGLTDEQIVAAAQESGFDMRAIPQTLPHEGWLIGISNGLLKMFPGLERPIIEAFLRQAAVYIENEGVRLQIKSIVKRQVLKLAATDRAVVIGHSLGSVVSYELLARDKSFLGSVPLFLTVGSPLAIPSFMRLFGQHNIFPNPPVQRWVNGRHLEDFVTLSRPIEKTTLGFEGVLDETNIVNNTGNKHNISAYLSSPVIARTVFEGLTA